MRFLLLDMEISNFPVKQNCEEHLSIIKSCVLLVVSTEEMPRSGITCLDLYIKLLSTNFEIIFISSSG